MKPAAFPACSHCGSDNVLPFEEEARGQKDTTLFFILLVSISLLVGYFLFLISVYLTFPLVVFVSIIATSRFINKEQRPPTEKEHSEHIEKDYVCLKCGNFFNG